MSTSRLIPAIEPNKDGSVTIQYVPTQSGVHELNLSYNETPVEGTPFRVNVDASDGGSSYVTAYGPGLVHGSCGNRLQFYVTRGGTKEDIEVSIDGPSKADIVKKEERNGLMTVDYIAGVPGEYNINVKCANKPIYGSPFSAKISGEGRKRSVLAISGTSDYSLGGCDVDLNNMVGHITNPDGTIEDCILKKLPNGKLGLGAFEPKRRGTYKVDVMQEDAEYPGSPFQIQVGEFEMCTASKVRATGAIAEGKAGKLNHVILNVQDAGYGSMVVAVDGSYRVDLSSRNTGIGEYTLTYKPPEPGIYLMSIKYGEDHIKGSPFLLTIGGETSGRVRTLVVKQIQAAETVTAGQNAELQFKLPGSSPLDMEANIASPGGKIELCEIRDSPTKIYNMKFAPVENGVNVISIKEKGIHIAGSPFHYTVGKSSSGGVHKVEFGGRGAERGDVNVKNDFNIYTHEAGPGILSVGIDGPSKAEIEIFDTRTGYVTCSYVVTKEGDYTIGVKYNGVHVPKSPCGVYIDPECKEAKMVTIHGLKDRGIDVDKPATFSVNLGPVRGDLKGVVTAPSGTIDEMFMQELDDDLYSFRFLPKENGVYHLHIKFNEAHIPGSPFPMLVGKLGADPALLTVSGDGLEKGAVGRPNKFVVITTLAALGTLGVFIEGPSKCLLRCMDVEEGYEFSYNPKAPGDYMINIKFCHVNLAGCPFVAKITGKGKASEHKELSNLYIETAEKKPGCGRARMFQGDASKVIIVGTGLKKGFIGRVSTFTLDFKDAGQGLLSMAMISPTGCPAKELTCKKSKPAFYTCSYLAEEKGDHFLTIQWCDKDIPGSPFIISIS